MSLTLDFLLKGFVVPESYKIFGSVMIFFGAMVMVVSQLYDNLDDIQGHLNEMKVIASLVFLCNLFSCFSENRINS
jgi:hypothetical protein